MVTEDAIDVSERRQYKILELTRAIMPFTFTHLDKKKFVVDEDSTIQALLRKWSLLGRVTCQAYAFDQPFEEYNLATLIKDFVGSPSVAATLLVWRRELKEPLGKGSQLEEIEKIPCQLTSMEIFKRLYDTNVLREDGEIIQCFEEYHEDLILNDNLKKVLVQEEGEFWDVYSEEERNELLFHLFKLVVLGGECCQFEDNFHNYGIVTKALYKDLISPQVVNGKVAVTSFAAKIRLRTARGLEVPEDPSKSQNVFLVVVNPHTRTVHTLLHQHGVGDMD
ncbi:cilia- and flagella-associated protein 300-like [Macrobrachium rosenbergii]|uniref:cilia- and flagella-associated protein 300-like n=1 Tax=Macrobrachium rosenbergii TaxID=79674 RepID=UPI0034D751F0